MEAAASLCTEAECGAGRIYVDPGWGSAFQAN
jgi:hypothetical protein